jgi:hypothetical protein
VPANGAENISFLLKENSSISLESHDEQAILACGTEKEDITHPFPRIFADNLGTVPRKRFHNALSTEEE